jgi:hypothetical protein
MLKAVYIGMSLGRLLPLTVENNHVSMLKAVYIGWALWMTVVPLHAVAVWGATPGTLGIMYTVMAVAGAVGAPLGGTVRVFQREFALDVAIGLLA